MLERSLRMLKRLVSGSQGSNASEVSKQAKKFNPKERKDGNKMTDVKKMDEGYKGKTYTINGLDGDF